ncbi:ferrochelatase [Novispirillum sp. DQ9]|uniref:ferrochelatase n=1 Tax=Novispirillum sp. DQ9 TaxID=3398612 RepID=UPI003C7C511C
MSKLAVVLFNLGGPDSPAAVRPFLFNLFNDPAIIGAPGPVRWALAQLISRRRAPVAQHIYARLGGKSPLLEQTQSQARALEGALSGAADEVRAFIAMRYWHPMTAETVAAVKAFAPDRVVLLPLYPQYSGTTSGSSLKAWRQEAARQGLGAPAVEVCCWPTAPGWIDAMAQRVAAAVHKMGAHGEPRVLFSAHGLPKKVIAAGDPYQWQVERTAAAVVDRMALPGLDWQVCYQSRVGPLEWIGPSTDAEIRRAGGDGVPVVLVPIAFVSEHSETLVELDEEYRDLAEAEGVTGFHRVPTVSSDPVFIAGLADLVRGALAGGCAPCSQDGGRLCPQGLGVCPNQQQR